MENLGAMADSRYTGFREITNGDVLDLQCIPCLCSVDPNLDLLCLLFSMWIYINNLDQGIWLADS